MRDMGRAPTVIATFLLTAALMGAFLFGFDLVADSVPGQYWLITLLFIIPVWPIMAVIELTFDLPLEVTHPIQNVMASLFWGLVASGSMYLFLPASRRQKVA